MRDLNDGGIKSPRREPPDQTTGTALGQDEIRFFAGMALSAASALVYGLYFLRRPESLARALVKTGLMAGVAIAFWGAPPPLMLAFIAAGIGDFLLAFEKRSWVLPLGMLAFLLSQLAYILCFGALWFFSGDNAPLWPRYIMMAAAVLIVLVFLLVVWRDPARKGNPLLAIGGVTGALTLGATPAVFILVGYASSFDDIALWQPHELALFWGALALSALFIWLRRDLGAVPLAGMVYAAVLTQMALMSFWLPWAGWMAMLGAFLFLVSDGVLSWEIFRLAPDAPVRRITAPVVWWTYAGAQWLIALGLMFTARAVFNPS
jgi:hypothetical protein